MIKINQELIDITRFPDNTTQVWKIPEKFLTASTVSIQWEYQHDGEFLELAQLKDLLDVYGVVSWLFINYLPYARQDKGVANFATFGLWPFSRLLNSLKFEKILILDPHSDLATKLIHNSTAIYPTYDVQQLAQYLEVDGLVYPDAGAKDKYTQLYGKSIAYASKVRDVMTGAVLDIKVRGDVAGKKLLIVDDICDGGSTFVQLADELFHSGAHEIHLFVTHGIFSKGIKPLQQAGYRTISTTKGFVREFQETLVYNKLWGTLQ